MSKIIVAQKKGSTPDWLCGNCFAFVERDDSYCWHCGEILDKENPAFNIKDLIEEIK